MLPNSEYAIVSGFKNAVSLFSILEGEEIVSYHGAVIGKYPVQCAMGMVKGELYVASGSELNEVVIWNLQGVLRLKSRMGGNGFICGVDFSKNGLVACCGPNEKFASFVMELSSEDP